MASKGKGVSCPNTGKPGGQLSICFGFYPLPGCVIVHAENEGGNGVDITPGQTVQNVGVFSRLIGSLYSLQPGLPDRWIPFR